MCGVAAVIVRGEPVGEETLHSLSVAVQAMAHRGPDGSGIWSEGQVALGHRRLSVIDLSSHAAQPFHRSDLSLHISYNGEIYNYRELKATLTSMGYKFFTETDTEVVLVAYHHYGEDFVRYLRGMFAVALYDARQKKVLFVRDRMGKKPLYLAFGPQRALASSDIRSFHAFQGQRLDVDQESVRAFFALQFIPGPFTIYKQVQRIPPGTIVSLDLHEWRLQQQAYWSIEEALRSRPPEGTGVADFAFALAESVRYRLIADVEVGVLLSGGIDSSIIAALARECGGRGLRAFTVSFPQVELDESPQAQEVARAHDMEFVKASGGAVLPDTLEDIVSHCGEPLGDPACVPTFMIARELSKYLKVVLSGEGADELFWGYPHYVRELKHQVLKASQGRLSCGAAKGIVRQIEGLPWIHPGLSRFAKIAATAGNLGVLRWVTVFGEASLDQLLRSERSTDPPRYIMQVNDMHERLKTVSSPSEGAVALDLAFWLPDDLLVKVDRMSMAHGVEARAPFLDQTIVDLSLRLPADRKIRGDITKVVLREFLDQLVHEKHLGGLAQRPKHGFEPPVREWLAGDLRALASEHLLTGRYLRDGGVDVRPASRAWESFLHTRATRSYVRRLWLLLVFSLWLKHHQQKFRIQEIGRLAR